MCEDFIRWYSEEAGLLFGLMEIMEMSKNYGLSL
jgi:hypothetical protein